MWLCPPEPEREKGKASDEKRKLLREGKASDEKRKLKESEEEEPPDETDPNLTEEEQKAHIRQRTCTDAICVLLFVLAMLGLFEVLRYGWEHGDTRRIYYGLNWEGEVCGVDPAVRAKPLLYWCTKPDQTPMSEDSLNQIGIPTEITDGLGNLVSLANKVFAPTSNLDLLHPICLDACPLDPSTFHPCLQYVETEKQAVKNFDGTFWKNSTFVSRLVQDIKTFTFAHRYCLPPDNFFVETVNQTFQTTSTQFLYGVAELVEARKVFFIAGCLAVVVSYIYMFTIDCLSYPVVYSFLFVCTAGPMVTSLYFLYGAFYTDFSDAIKVHVGFEDFLLPTAVTTSDRNWDIVIAVVTMLVGIGVGCFWCCKQQSINFVIVAIKAAIRVLYDVPTLILLPAVNTALRGCVLVVAMWGFALMVSLGEVAPYEGFQPGGLVRTFNHTQDERLLILYYIFAAAWIYELLLALQQFVVAYTVLIWYNAPLVDGKKKVPCLPIIRAVFMGLTYHLGSLAFGAVLLAFLRVVYVLVKLFYNQAKQTEDDNANAVVKTVAGCCCCCLSCFEQALRYLNQGAYVMVAVNSDGYCKGADRAISLVARDFVAIGALEGSTFIFQALGNIAIPGLGGYFTYLLVTQLEQFSTPGEPDYIAQPKLIAAAGGLICLGVSVSFMAIFDTVSDAMLFAFMTDEDWRREHRLPPNPHIPENLQSLLDTAS